MIYRAYEEPKGRICCLWRTLYELVARAWHNQLISLHPGRKFHRITKTFHLNFVVNLNKFPSQMCRCHEIMYCGQSNVGGLSVPFLSCPCWPRITRMVQAHLGRPPLSCFIPFSSMYILSSILSFLCPIPSSLLGWHLIGFLFYLMPLGDICWYLLFCWFPSWNARIQSL